MDKGNIIDFLFVPMYTSKKKSSKKKEIFHNFLEYNFLINKK